MPKTFNLALIKLLSKGKVIKTAADFRPISLINTNQKIFSHLLAARFKKVLQKVILPDQYAYLENRSIYSFNEN